jgi:hypothetical protein
LLKWDLLTHRDALSCKLLLLAPKEGGLKENLTSLLLLVVEDKLMMDIIEEANAYPVSDSVVENQRGHLDEYLPDLYLVS